MKKSIIIFILLVLTITSTHGGWFNSGVEAERERRQEAESRTKELDQQLQAQRERTNKWQIATGSFAVASIIFLSLGAALGAKAKRDEKSH
jgi:hypothetical protein